MGLLVALGNGLNVVVDSYRGALTGGSGHGAQMRLGRRLPDTAVANHIPSLAWCRTTLRW